VRRLLEGFAADAGWVGGPACDPAEDRDVCFAVGRRGACASGRGEGDYLKSRRERSTTPTARRDHRTALLAFRLQRPRDERTDVATKTVRVSDLSGAEIPDGEGATVRINFADARKGSAVLDVTNAEGEELAAKGRRQARRGRKPRGASA